MQTINHQKAAYLNLIFLGLLATAPQVFGQTQNQNPTHQQLMPQGPNRQPIRLQVLGKEAFCTRLVQAFSAFGSQVGYNPTQTALLANGATTRLIQDFRSGRASDFLNSQAILTDVNLHQIKVAAGKQELPGYLATAQFLGRALGVSDNVSLALSAGELRFLPHVAKGTDVIVVARNAAALTIERINKIAEMARTMNIRVNVLWVGETNEDAREIEEARVLAWIVASTGGKFANLGGAEWPCANQL